ncbi:AAA family ATPase [Amycolatopsis taiwanensis]|uniref:ATPase AAA n=1 Tax=Amycolatopsis taiwanensis TaxID=342230 RepID=A0A9W6VLX9_9PSEU|nr:AAA family ATPase [Amycolatopsis taiwanensis]GLY70971.1 ATPase AAA [Amycolatopsis taiwanensis]
MTSDSGTVQDTDHERDSGGIVLRVAEAPLEDVDRGTARIDGYLLARIGVRPGMVVAISGERRTVAVAHPAPPQWQGTHQIMMDGMVRENARAVVGEPVTVSAIDAQPAATVLIEPLDAGTFGAREVAEIRDALVGRAMVYGDRLKVTVFSKRGHLFQVAGTQPETAVVAGPFTDVRIKRDPATLASQPPLFKIKYEDIGGLEDEVLRVRELVELPLKYPALFARLKIEPPKGVLLYGPPGSGKTLIARAVASEVKAHFIHVNGPEIIHKFYGESEAKLREIFEEAHRRAPSVIFLDEIDAIAPRRIDVSGEVEKRVVAQLLASMDGLVSRGEVVVIGATNLPEAVDPALRRPGRFDREIPVNVPTRTGRLRILQIHSRGMPLADDVDLEALAEITHGFVGADLEALCKEAGMLAIRDCFAELDATDAASTESLAEGTSIRAEHFAEALKAIEPTTTREFFLERPNVRWEDIGGLEHIRRTVSSALQLPRAHPSLFTQAGIRPPTGFLFAGPSGTGKSLTVKALATETGLRLITVDAASLLSKWVGESEKGLREVFKKAKQSAPCILFFDGLDGLVPIRHGHPEMEGGLSDRLARQFFSELDEAVEFGNVVLIGATNRPDLIDPAVLRPGRLGYTVNFSLPDQNQRERILDVQLRKMRLAPEVNLSEMAGEMKGLSGAEIAGLCQRAALAEIERFVERHGSAAEEKAARGELVLSAEALRDSITALHAKHRTHTTTTNLPEVPSDAHLS